jgi:pyruvate/2-oxoglutarate dehydrogenase complex dihydrolipoamide acyltransferase (E2) component
MNMEQATIVCWRKHVGDQVAKDEVLYEVETEKVTSEVASAATGTLVEILVPSGAELEVGDPVCRLEVG